MNLGERLKAATAAEQEAARRAALFKQSELDENALCAKLRAQHFFDYAFNIFAHRLSCERAPGLIKLGGDSFRDVAIALGTSSWRIPEQKSRLWRTEGVGIWSQANPLYAVWDEFDQRCTANGLEPQWAYCHDMGSTSWYELTVSAIN